MHGTSQTTLSAQVLPLSMKEKQTYSLLTHTLCSKAQTHFRPGSSQTMPLSKSCHCPWKQNKGIPFWCTHSGTSQITLSEQVRMTHIKAKQTYFPYIHTSKQNKHISFISTHSVPASIPSVYMNFNKLLAFTALLFVMFILLLLVMLLSKGAYYYTFLPYTC